MGTKLFLIVTANKVYGTYHKTICYVQSFRNEGEKSEAKLQARQVLFSKALTFGSVYCEDFETRLDSTDQDIFDFLEQRNK